MHVLLLTQVMHFNCSTNEVMAEYSKSIWERLLSDKPSWQLVGSS